MIVAKWLLILDVKHGFVEEVLASVGCYGALDSRS